VTDVCNKHPTESLGLVRLSWQQQTFPEAFDESKKIFFFVHAIGQNIFLITVTVKTQTKIFVFYFKHFFYLMKCTENRQIWMKFR
jgi:hypothetical protein